ncbi:MAG: glycosyltransferase family 2 protein, partial [Candidatus Rokuibacteriota bacterium]
MREPTPRRGAVYVMLPAFNEEGSLPPLLGRIKTALEGCDFGYHVVVVNDGSTDRTLEIARRHAETMPLTIVDHGRNRGLGEAMRSGFLESARLAENGDAIVTMDADNTHAPELIPTMFGRIRDGFDLVVASRFVPGGRQIGLRAYRRLLSRCAGLVMRTLFPVAGVTDYSCGYRAYSARILKRGLEIHGPDLVEEQGFSCFVDVLLKLRRMNVRACEVPLVLRYDFKAGASKMRIGRTIRRYIRLMARNLVAPGARPFRRFAPAVAAPGVASAAPARST